jgi:hypothetical protein
MKSSFIFMLFSIFSAIANASFTKGNGGNVIFCATEPRLIVLDFYEMSEFHSFSFDKNLTALSIDNLAPRLQKIVFVQTNSFDKVVSFKNIFANFELKTKLIPGDLGKVDDSFHIGLPKNCELMQAAIQRQAMYLISEKIWSQLDFQQQDVLKLHEVIYNLLLRSQALVDSRPVRALTGLLLSAQLESMKTSEIRVFLIENGIKF